MSGNDTALGGEGDDTLQGQLGNDLVLGGTGVGSVNGNHGTDTVAGGADPGDDVIGETIDEEFVFDAAWVNV